MVKATYTVGANNATRELETDKICGIISRYLAGFTAFECVGYWRGSRERSLRVEAHTELNPMELQAIAGELASALAQESVMLELSESSAQFIH